jgi:hypothetical protein
MSVTFRTRSKEHRESRKSFACFVAAALSAPVASAQWTVTNLHPAGATESRAHGVSGGQQVGRATIDGQYHASVWTGISESWIDLNPAGALSSDCWDVDDGSQVGTITTSGTQLKAAMWKGSATSYISLHPPGSSFSTCYGVSGDMQVGGARWSGTSPFLRATTWTGTAASAVDRHPPFAGDPFSWPIRQSEFYGVRDGELVGYWWGTLSSPPFRGTMWNGAALVDITPALPPVPAAAVQSNVNMTSRGQHVGFATAQSSVLRAILWPGAGQLAIELSPAGSSTSWAQGIWRGQQVGSATFGVERAVLWNGTAASVIDLHGSLPVEFISSNARGIWSDRFNTYVVGWGTNSATERTEALMWSRASCWADLTHNEVVDDEDFSPFAIAYDELICPAKLCPADLNDDGVVDDADFQLFVAAYDSLLCP